MGLPPQHGSFAAWTVMGGGAGVGGRHFQGHCRSQPEDKPSRLSVPGGIPSCVQHTSTFYKIKNTQAVERISVWEEAPGTLQSLSGAGRLLTALPRAPQAAKAHSGGQGHTHVTLALQSISS